ncbi:MAG: hypothetical protein FWH40_06540 [Coriobacteriia bacterium]|nr:hypothetical protein [Coriobacteriia bacterium]
MNDKDESTQAEYTLEDLLEQAKNDPSWEPDEQKRAELTQALLFSVGR